MAKDKKYLFEDDDCNQIKFYPNNLRRLYLEIGKEDDQMDLNYIVLDKDDIKNIINALQKIINNGGVD